MNPLHNTTSHAEKLILINLNYPMKLTLYTYLKSHWARKEKTCQVESLEVTYSITYKSQSREEDKKTILQFNC